MIALVFVGGIVCVALAMAIGSIFNGYALSVLWGWFVVPVFGLPQISIVPAIGIAIVVSYLTYQMHDCKKEENENFAIKVAVSFLNSIIRPLFVLFLGWIVHLFM